MRVLMLSDVYFPRVNGVSTSIQTFRRDLAELGCETHLIAPSYPSGWSDDERVTRVPSRYLPLDPEDRVVRADALLQACRRLRGRFDVLHVQTPFVAHRVGVRLARELGRPTVETYHTFFEEYLHHYAPLIPRVVWRTLARGLSRRQCNEVDALVAPSAALAAVLRSYGVTAPIDVVSTGIDLQELTGGDGGAFRSAFGIEPARPVMLHVGRAAFEKNIGFILRVAARVKLSVPDVLLVVAGEGPALPKLRGEARELGLDGHVLFVGYLDRRGALLDCYRAADVFVFASRTETQGLVLLEAMALEVPVVSTAVLGTREVLAGAGGAVVTVEDEAPFAGAVVRVLTEPGLRQSLSAAARSHVVEHWSSREMAARLLGLYRRLAASVDCAAVPASASRAAERDRAPT